MINNINVAVSLQSSVNIREDLLGGKCGCGWGCGGGGGGSADTNASAVSTVSHQVSMATETQTRSLDRVGRGGMCQCGQTG